MKYDFEYLTNLYKEDPKEFEKVTSELINDVIDNTPERNREKYRAKQWRLTEELKKIKNPVERMNKMVQIFWSSVNEFVDKTNNPENYIKSPPKDNILKFKPKKS